MIKADLINYWNSLSGLVQRLIILFFIFLDSYSIKVQKDSIMNNDSEFLKNRIKSELAGSIWGKNENTNIRLRFDNQVIEALKHFNEADAFIQSSN